MTMTRAEVAAYFRAEGVTEPIPTKGRMVLRVFPVYMGRPFESITNEGGGQYTLENRTLQSLRRQES